MEEDEIIINPYKSFISDPDVESDLDRSGIRTTTQTDQQLLANVPDAVGLRFDPTNFDYTKDLYNYYGGDGLPMIDTATDTNAVAPVTNAPITNVADTSSGTGSQITGSQDQAASGLGTDTSMIGGDLDQGGAGDGITNYEYTPEETTEQQQAIDQSIQDLGVSYDPMTELPTDPAIADAALSGSFYVPTNEEIKAAEDPMMVDAYNLVLQGVSTVGDFIAQYGTKAAQLYNLVKGGTVGAITGGSSLLGLNPVTGLIGLGLSKVADIVKNTPSQLEYDAYSDEQKEIIEQEYGLGGVMEGYNTVSSFGEGIEATIESRLAERTENGIYDETTERLQNLANTVNPSRTNITAAVYDFDDDSQGEQQTFDSQQADQEFAETGDYDVYSGGDTGATSSPTPAADYSYEGSDEQDEASNYDSTPSPASEPDQRDRGGDGSGGGGGGGKIVCTMMNENYGFGSFRNRIWQKYAKDNLTKEHEKGYHKIFLPLVKLSKTNVVIRKVLEHIAVHRTIDIRQEARGKVHILGRAYRKVLEPICYLVGKYVK